MARQPFYGRGPGPAIARMDMNAATAPGRAYGQMYANLGKQVGDTIEEYGLNKKKRAKLTGEIEAYYDQNKDALAQIGMSGDEVQDKKDFSQRDKFVKGDMSMAELEGYAGKLARGDVLKNQAAQNETRAIANELGRVNLGISKELKDTQIQLEKDKGILSGINTKVAKMRERGLTKEEQNMLKKLDLLGKQTDALSDNLDYKTEAERQDALLKTATSKANIGLVNPRAEATKAALTTSVLTNEQAQNLMPGQTSNALKKLELDSRKIDGENFLIDAFGGAEKKAKFDYRGEELKRENFEKGLEYLGARIDYTKYLSTAKNVPIDTKKQYASLVSHSGKILDTTVEDPDTGNQITFQEYMEKANDDPDLYPLKGDGSGAAGVLYGNFQNAQKQIIDFGKTIQVQVDDGQGAGGSPAPTGSTMDVSNLRPEQAMQQLQDRIGQIRRQLPQLNAQEQQLGQPGQMTTTAFDTSPFGNVNTPLAVRPQTIGDVQNSNIPQQRSDLMAELQQLEAKRQDLQNQFGVR
tara:strand:- start:341 stop:1909 length:1569 start_codon:yes stop_codon:yes gene_type:complete